VNRSWFHAALALAAAGLLALLLFLGAVPVERYAAVSSDLAGIKEADARLTLQVFETRLGLLWNYDGLVRETRRMRLLMDELRHHDEELGGEKSRPSLEALAGAVDDKLELVETFKTNNAVLRFNLRYLPEASRNLVDGIDQETALSTSTRRDLRRLVERVTAEVLQLMAENGPPPSDLPLNLAELAEAAATVESLLAADIERFTAFASLITQLKPKVDTLMGEIERVPVSARADALSAIYARQRDTLIRAVERYRWMLFGAAVLLLVYLTAVLVRLRRISARLQSTMADMQFQQFAMDQHAIVLVLDPRGIITYANDKFCNAVRMRRESVLGRHYRSFWPAGDAGVFEGMWQTLRDRRVWHGEISNQPADGGVLWLSATGVPFVDSEGTPNRYVVICTDISTRKVAEEQLRYQARHDSLTGLLNRRALERHLGLALEDAKRRHARHALLYVDLDQFKVINDTCGHMAGDEVLRQLGAELGRTIPSTDIVARLGGDEFGILLRDCQATGAIDRAQAIHRVIGAFRFVWEDQVFQLSASIGVAPVAPDTPSVAAVLASADVACAMAKEKGRNRIHFYEPDDQELQQRHNEMQWVSRIKQALEEERFELFAQRIVPVRAAASRPHYEVLLRMRDAQGRMVMPGAFIPAAERYSLMDRLDRWVIATALDKLDRHHRQLPAAEHPMLSINVSGASLGQSDLLEFISDRLRSSAVDPAQVCFEITETAAISNLREAERFLSAVRELGCQVALDDFGSGLSSFTYLKRLPVDVLKIDGSFVRDLCHEPLSAAMVQAVTRIAGILEIETIAEFVENEETLVALREAGVDYAQGYLIHRPAPMDEVMGLETVDPGRPRSRAAY